MAAAPPSVLALDVGTTGVRALRIDATGAVCAQSYEEVLPTYPGPGLVEHDTEATLQAVHAVLRAALADAPPGSVRGLGLTSQRSTAVVWDTNSGRAVHPAVSWQDARTHDRCMELLGQGIGHLDARLQRRAQLAVLDQALDRFAHGGVEHVGVQRLAVHLAHEVRGHLARAEAGHAHLRGDLLDLGVDLRVEILGRDGQRVAALEAFVGGFDDLHFKPSSSAKTVRGRRGFVDGGIGAGEGTRTPTSCDTGT
jgi:hypothetical protein